MDSRNSKKLYWLGRRPGDQGPRLTLGSQGVGGDKCATGASPEGGIPRPDGALMATGNRNNIQLRKAIRIGTWNVRSLIQIGKQKLLSDELSRNQIAICGLSEVWMLGRGHFTTDDGHTIAYSGHDEMQRQGVAVWLRKDIAKCLISY